MNRRRSRRPTTPPRCGRVLAGEELPRSRARHLHVATEVAKALALLALGVSVLTNLTP
ncbi:hypothetical protein [Actinacidiphila yanglinensis]|uniref:hypothetical protein n=1 Tax=Actinacidiphila yanglinensis TaxID=310779 RepID=UPI0013572B09|nr:hypothetical protein [Actinacidiphila yanglinensis]